jgi:hypothetical protein
VRSVATCFRPLRLSHRTDPRLTRYGGGFGRELKRFPQAFQIRGHPMVISATELSPIVALIAGILILIMPRLLNYIVALYLIFVGLMGLNAVHHFLH